MLVSVAIPAHNQAEYLRVAIESVLAQTYQEIEIVVVDDGSTDHTRQVCAEFDRRVRYIYQEHDETLGGSARRRAVIECRGELVAMLDQDDRWLPSKLEKQVSLMSQAPVLAVVFTGWRIVDSQGDVTSEEFNEAPSGDVFHLLLERNRYLASSGLMRREVLVSCLPDPTFKPGDYYLWLKIARDHKVGFIPECLTEYRRHGNNYSLDYVNMALIQERLLNHFANNKTLFHPNCVPCEQSFERGLVRVRTTKAMAYFQEYCRLAKKGQLALALSHFKRMIDTKPQFIFDVRRVLAAIKSLIYGVGSLTFLKSNSA